MPTPFRLNAGYNIALPEHLTHVMPPWTIPGYLEIVDGHLNINGIDALSLVQDFDTPLFVFSASRIRQNIQRLSEAASHHARLKLCYASKANNLLGVLRVVKDAGIDVEVNSGGELFRALRAGFQPDQIEMNGVAKTEREVEEAIEAGIYSINVDSAYELEMIKQVAARIGKRCNVTVRLIAGVGTRSHIGLQTALDTSKFGISPAEARYVMLSAIQNEHLVNLAGIHVHVGSQTPDIAPYRQAFGAMWEHLVWLYGETGHKLEHINIGGGIPVNYLRDRSLAREFVEETRTMLEADLTAAEMIDAAVGAVRDSARLSGALELLEDSRNCDGAGSQRDCRCGNNSHDRSQPQTPRRDRRGLVDDGCRLQSHAFDGHVSMVLPRHRCFTSGRTAYLEIQDGGAAVRWRRCLL